VGFFLPLFLLLIHLFVHSFIHLLKDFLCAAEPKANSRCPLPVRSNLGYDLAKPLQGWAAEETLGKPRQLTNGPSEAMGRQLMILHL
jgi:hypothetical protein